jgi:hypothetical protein
MKMISARNDLGRAVTEEVLDEAITRGLEHSHWEPHAVSVRYLEDRKAIELEFDDSTAITLPVANNPYLRDLMPQELDRLRIGFGGVAICLDEQDFHVSIAGLVAASRPLTEVAVAVTATKPAIVPSAVEMYELNEIVSQIHEHLVAYQEREILYWANKAGVTHNALVDALEQLTQSARAALAKKDEG